jgi:putative flippase GtrA
MCLSDDPGKHQQRPSRHRRTTLILLCEDVAVLRQLARPRVTQSPLARLFTRFAAGTVVSTVCSQLTLVLMFGVVGTSASVAGGAAFLAGAVPNFLIHRFWTWRRCGPVGMRRELLPYLAVTTVSGLVAIGIITGVDRLLGNTITDHAVRTTVLAVTFVISYLPLFVLKFALLDRLVFGCAKRRPSADSRQSDASWAARRRRDRDSHDSRDQVPTSTRA